MEWQFDWRGIQLQNTRHVVCPNCYDKPQRQLGSIMLPPDPPSLKNARPENYAIDEAQLPVTTLTAANKVGDVNLAVASSTGFHTGQTVAVQLDNGNFFTSLVTVNSPTSMTVALPLTYTAAVGNQVSIILVN